MGFSAGFSWPSSTLLQTCGTAHPLIPLRVPGLSELIFPALLCIRKYVGGVGNIHIVHRLCRSIVRQHYTQLYIHFQHRLAAGAKYLEGHTVFLSHQLIVRLGEPYRKYQPPLSKQRSAYPDFRAQNKSGAPKGPLIEVHCDVSCPLGPC